jgi:hypothetical protein
VHEADVAAVVGHERDRGGHAAADGVPGDRHALRVEPVGGPLAHDPAGGGVALLDRHGVLRFGRAVVLDEGDGRAGSGRQLADEPVVGAGVAEHPAAAVHVEDHGQRAFGALGPDDADAHVSHVGRNGDPAVVDRQLVDRRGLDVVEHGAGLVRCELVQERRLGRRLDERLRGGLEHDGRARAGDGHSRDSV